jgi:hypothetical protein
MNHCVIERRRTKPVNVEVRGFKVEGMALSEHSDNDLGPITVHLKDADEADDVIGGETGTVVDLKIEKGGIRFVRSDNDYGDKLTEKLVPWSELLPPYQDESETPPVFPIDG